MTVDISRYRRRIQGLRLTPIAGRVVEIVGLLVKAEGLSIPVDEICLIDNGNGRVPAEVIGFNQSRQTLLMVLGDMAGISPGSIVTATGKPSIVPVGDALLGRVIDSLGESIDGKGAIVYHDEYPIYQSPPSPLKRHAIDTAIPTGVRAIDALMTLGKGQRIGIFGGSGIGKSILLGMIAQNTEADVNVIALIGERGREVHDFVTNVLGESGLKRSVVVAATSDQPALMRIRGAFTAVAIAEYFRDLGKDVMFMMDSVTRFATAQREVGMTVGEPPTTRGYTPSVFALLPKLLERSGTSDKAGSITGVYTVLVEGDDLMEPIVDAVRSILDGHIVLSRELASQGHYPAIDVLESISRLMVEIVPEVHQSAADALREMAATYQANQTLINIGLYRRGADARIDASIEYRDKINDLLTQKISEKADYEESISMLANLLPNQQ